MGWQWHPLDHIQIICTSLQTDNHASTSPLKFFLQAGCPSCRPTNSIKALKATKPTSKVYIYRIMRRITNHQNINLTTMWDIQLQRLSGFSLNTMQGKQHTRKICKKTAAITQSNLLLHPSNRCTEQHCASQRQLPSYRMLFHHFPHPVSKTHLCTLTDTDKLFMHHS